MSNDSLLFKKASTKADFESMIFTMLKPEFHKDVVAYRHKEGNTTMTLYYIENGDKQTRNGEEVVLDKHIGTYCKGSGWMFKSALNVCK